MHGSRETAEIRAYNPIRRDREHFLTPILGWVLHAPEDMKKRHIWVTSFFPAKAKKRVQKLTLREGGNALEERKWQKKER